MSTAAAPASFPCLVLGGAFLAYSASIYQTACQGRLMHVEVRDLQSTAAEVIDAEILHETGLLGLGCGVAASIG